MTPIDSIAALETLYGQPGAPSLRKVADHLGSSYGKWVGASRFCVLSTVGPEGTDASPRGDDGPVVQVLDPKTLAMPDWRGNNRLDSLRNIVRDGRVSLMFFVAGSNNVVRVNGQAVITADAALRQRFAKGDTQPATVIVITLTEVYSQCARALLRSGLWQAAGQTPDLPSMGDILAELSNGAEGGAPYDQSWGARAAKTMW